MKRFLFFDRGRRSLLAVFIVSVLVVQGIGQAVAPVARFSAPESDLLDKVTVA
jgi:hypothetical protein